MEGVLSLTKATTLVNEYLLSMGTMHVGWSCVYSAHLRMEPMITLILDGQQGSEDDKA
jgi:hypothetical protein